MTEQFHYRHQDSTVTLPYLRNIKVGVIRKLRNLTPENQFFGILEAVADKATLEVIDDMTADEFGHLMEAWQKESGITVGESVASPTT